MAEEKILHGFLEKLVKKAFEQIEKDGNLSQENALPFLIQDQYSKIAHIEEKFVTNESLIDFKQEFIDFRSDVINKFAAMDEKFNDVCDRFEKMDAKFEDRFERMDAKFDKKFNDLYKVLGLGFSIMTLLIGIMKYIN